MKHPLLPQPLAVFGPALAPPVIAEQAHEALGDDLADALLPLTVYCERQEAREDLSNWQADHVAAIRQALAMLTRYDTQFEGLLAAYRQHLATAHARLTERVPPLEMALVQAGPDWQAIGFRLLNRLYQHAPGLALACQHVAVQPKARLDWEAICFRLLDRLHRHEVPAPPSPFVASVRAFLDSPAMIARAALPLAERPALASVTSATLDTAAA